jgi:hypothetical protein
MCMLLRSVIHPGVNTNVLTALKPVVTAFIFAVSLYAFMCCFILSLFLSFLSWTVFYYVLLLPFLPPPPFFLWFWPSTQRTRSHSRTYIKFVQTVSLGLTLLRLAFMKIIYSVSSFLTGNTSVSIRKTNQIMHFRHIIRLHCEKSYVKGKGRPRTGHEGLQGSTGIAVFFNHGVMWGWVVKTTRWALYPRYLL